MNSLKFYLVFCLCILSAWTVSAESLGEIEVDDILVRTGFFYQDPHHGEFSIDQSSLGVFWHKGKHVSARLRIGSLDLIHRPTVFIDEANDELGVFEAYAQYSGVYGRVRAGLIPIGFGYEGALQESRLHFQRSLLFSKNIIGLRDFGFSYEIGDSGFLTHFSVHNGEGDADNKDGRVYFTTRWAWGYDASFQLGASMQVGETRPESTSTSTTSIANMDVNQESLWRTADVFVHKEWKRLTLDFEAYFGEVVQQDLEKRFYGGHLDLVYENKKRHLYMFRYDYLEPSDIQDDDIIQEITLGLGFKGPQGNSILYIMATQPLEESQSIDNNRYALVWKLTPELH